MKVISPNTFGAFLVTFAALLGATATSVAASPSTIEKTTYHGLPAYRLSDGNTAALIVPELSGRVMSFGAVDGTNWLWNGATSKKQGVWANWGGDKTFVGPHDFWRLYAPALWPPRADWDGPAFEARVEGDSLHTSGQVWPGFGVRIQRDFRFENGEFVITQTIEKVAGGTLPLSIWDVSQSQRPERVYIAGNPTSTYKNGFHAFGGIPDGAVRRTGNLLEIIPSSGGFYKIGVDSPVSAIAAVQGDQIWLQRAAKPEGDYPDGAVGAGFPVEFYNQGEDGAGAYVELELLSPLLPFRLGGKWTHTVRWSLHSLPVTPEARLSSIETLITGASLPHS